MNKPEVYLDLDGVVADFFTEYAKLAGIESGNYRDIPPAKTDPTLNKMVGTDFFNRLPKCPNADQVVAMIVKLYGHYHVCSSPLRGDHKNSEKWKKVWIQRELKPGPVDVIITPNKAKYAKQADGTPNILIDDRGSNISAWEAAGGIGIKYQADEDSLSKIVDGFTRARKIIKGEEEHKPQNLKSLDRSNGNLIAKSGDSDDHPTSAADVKENGEINPQFQSAPMMANEATNWSSMDPGAARQMLAAYRHFAPGIERFRDEEGANRLYKELNTIAVQTKQQNAFKSLIASARGWAHMEYDTNPGGFQNWFWKVGEMLEKVAEDDEEGGIEIAESASGGATSSGNITSAPAAGGGWLFGGTVGAPKGSKKKKSKVIKRTL
jgi:5'(3')-deoxyribonucleotidase